MGQTVTKTDIPTQSFSPETETITKKQSSSQFGQVKHVRDVKTGQDMYVKKIVCIDTESFNTQLAYYHARVNNPHPNFVNVVGYTSEQQKTYCAENNTIKVYFDSLQRNMEAEYEAHVLREELFSEVELQLLTENIITALAELQKRNIAHREISAANIFVTEEAYKLCDPSLNGQKAANGIIKYVLLGIKSLLAPELIKQIPTQDLEIVTNQFKADVFSLGATLLSLATLTRSEDLYDFENATIDFALLEKRIKFVEDIYSPTFSVLLKELLTVEEKERPDFVQLQERLNISEMIRAYSDKLQLESYVKVPYVKIVNELVKEITYDSACNTNEASPQLSEAKNSNNESPLIVQQTEEVKAVEIVQAN